MMTIIKTTISFLLIAFIITPSKGQSKECLEHFSRYDKTTIKGNYLLYHVKNDSVTLEYGNKSIHRLFPYKIECEIADSRIPGYEWDSQDFIVLRYGCGSPCWGVFVLPLDSINSIRNIMYEMAFDPDNNEVCYLGFEKYDNLIVENLKTKKSIIVLLPFKSDHGEFMGAWIEDVTIKNNKLYYRYSDPNVDYDKRKSTEVTIDINF
jgi:hypothetical protein